MKLHEVSDVSKLMDPKMVSAFKKASIDYPNEPDPETSFERYIRDRLEADDKTDAEEEESLSKLSSRVDNIEKELERIKALAGQQGSEL